MKIFNALICSLWLAPSLVGCTQPARAGDNIGRSIQKLKTQNQLTIGFIGGSITDGTGASHPSGSQDLQSWRGLVTQWFAKQYPTATISSINAGIGGTGSDLGAFRVSRDVGKADLVFVEFAVNDGNGPAAYQIKHLEGIVRNILTANPSANIVLITTLYYDRYNQNGWAKLYDNNQTPTSVQAHIDVAAAYDLPCLSVGKDLYEAIQNNSVSYENAFHYDPHPSRDGYAVYGKTVTDWLNQHQGESATAPTALPASLSEKRGGAKPIENGREVAAVTLIDDAGTKGEWIFNPVTSNDNPVKIEGSDTVIKRSDGYESYAQTSTTGAILHYRFSGSNEIGVVYGVSNSGGEIQVSVDDPTFADASLMAGRNGEKTLNTKDANIVGFIAQNYAIKDSPSNGEHDLYIKSVNGTNQIYAILENPISPTPK